MPLPISHARNLRIAETRDHLEVDGQRWFLLADTIWSAFTHVPDDDWPAYLHMRRRQGFNALLISALPILHDLERGNRAPGAVRGLLVGDADLRWAALFVYGRHPEKARPRGRVRFHPDGRRSLVQLRAGHVGVSRAPPVRHAVCGSPGVPGLACRYRRALRADSSRQRRRRLRE